MAKRLRKTGHRRLPKFVNGPPDAIVASDDGKSYIITTKLGARIAFATCGRCSLHVAHCTCPSGPSMPRSIEYIWDQDEAVSKSETWDLNHENYTGSFTKRERNRRSKLSLPGHDDAMIVTVQRKQLSVYVARARAHRSRAVARLLKGRK